MRKSDIGKTKALFPLKLGINSSISDKGQYVNLEKFLKSGFQISS
jgi:hypothetical protein